MTEAYCAVVSIVSSTRVNNSIVRLMLDENFLKIIESYNPKNICQD